MAKLAKQSPAGQPTPHPEGKTMNQTHWTFVANAAAQALAMLDAKEIDRQALRQIINNLHCFARDQAIITRQGSPRTLGGRLSQWRG